MMPGKIDTIGIVSESTGYHCWVRKFIFSESNNTIYDSAGRGHYYFTNHNQLTKIESYEVKLQ
jgi:hypothetical protein